MTKTRLAQSTWLTLGLGLLISAIGVWLVVRDVNLERLGNALSTADYGWVVAGAAAIGATLFARTRRWAILLEPIEYRGSTIMAALLIGQVLNFVLPIRAGDVVRSIVLGRAPGSSVERVLGSVAIEKAWDWIALTGLVLIVTLISPLPDWFIGPARTVGFVAAIVVIGFGIVIATPQQSWPRRLMLIDRLSSGLPRRWQLVVVNRLHRLSGSLDALRHRAAIWQTAFWSIVTWLLGVVANASVMRAFGINSWPAAMLLMAVLMVGVALPPSIAAVGIFEALTILALGTFGVPNETALAIGLTLHVVIFVPPVIAGSLLVAWESRAGRPLRSPT